MNNSEVIHRFAQLKGIRAKTSNGNLSCRNDVLYSYSTPIAALHKNEREEELVIITSRTYSVTTSGKHTPSTSDFYGVPVVRAPCVGVDGGQEHFGHSNYPSRDNLWVDKNLEVMVEDLEKELLRVSRARSRQSLGYAKGLAKNIEVLAKHFDKEIPETFYKLQGVWENVEDLNGLKAIQELSAQAKAKREAIRIEAIAKFRRGEHRMQILDSMPTLLRLTKSKEEVETSRGAKVPVQRLDKVWAIACAAREGKEIPKVLMHLGPYTFDTSKVSKNGNIEVGCHKIAFKELKYMAAELGFIQPVNPGSHVS